MMLSNLDVSIFYYINHLPHSEVINSIASFIHYATRGGLIYLPLLLIFFLNKKLRNLFWLMLFSGGISIALVDLILKPLIARPRPFEVLTNVITVLPMPTNASFPSSQTSTAAAVIMSCILLLPGRWKYLLWLWLIIVALDRIYMGHHYPSDVLAGAIIGVGISLIVNKYMTIKKASV